MVWSTGEWVIPTSTSICAALWPALIGACRATLTLRRRLLRAALTLWRRLGAALSGGLAAEYERQRGDAGGRRCGSQQLEIAHERNYTIATAGPEF